MKEHIQTQMVNELKDIAIKYHDHGCLRELMSKCVNKWNKGGERKAEAIPRWIPVSDMHKPTNGQSCLVSVGGLVTEESV